MSKSLLDQHKLVDTLLEEVNAVETLGNFLFTNISNSPLTGYSAKQAGVDANTIVASLERLEAMIKASGLLTLSSVESEAKSVATLTEEKTHSVERLFQQRDQLIQNTRAVLTMIGANDA
ncbi:hypothetical protein K7432_003444 [Basidiobolus ranarum]|uniref:Mediator of RNA polymerase II transcription subunit 21 n=1 Tax=Basidiobolus ranarum TaxID=34480 RepID=A0ABR2X001_9FUNG